MIKTYRCMEITPNRPRALARTQVMQTAGLDESDAKAFVDGAPREITDAAAWSLKLAGFTLEADNDARY